MTEEQHRILVVDDNRINRIKLTRVLDQQGYASSQAENGEEALEMLQSEDYDVVLLDIIMPGLDGYQVLERIKGDTDMRDIPVIVISALDEVDSAVRCIEMGAEDYLPKPFNPVLLRARLNASLQKKSLRDLEKAFLQQEMTLRQNEKLATLGKLSAGMAHELNNPAAAVQRGTGQLLVAFAEHLEAHLALDRADMTPTQIDHLQALDQLAAEKAKLPDLLDPIERSDREVALEDLLYDHNVEDAWQLAPELVALQLESGDLDGLAADFSGQQFALALSWLVTRFTMYSVFREVGEGAKRISEIVKALKTYTYLDQAPVQNVDIHEGLDNTLVMMRSKLRQGVTVHKEYDPNLPHIEAYGSELNQVWTNIIDNAIDAMDGEGEITLRTRRDGDQVIVELADDGPGMDEETQRKVFDPFFTTKGPGRGTGMGLNISHNIVVQRHGGRITVKSEPGGGTDFVITLPLHLQSEAA